MDTQAPAPDSYLLDRPALSPRTRLLIWLLAPPLIGLCSAGGTLTGILSPLERLTIDARFRWRGPRQPDPRIVVVEIDERSRRALGGADKRFDLRAHLDDAIEKLADAGSVCLGLDIWLQGRGDKATDTRLAEVMSETNVVLAVAVTGGMTMRAAGPFLETESPEGSIAVQPDPDGVLRRLPEHPVLDVVGADGVSTVRVPHFPFVLAYFALAEEQLAAGRDMPVVDFGESDHAVIAGRRVKYGELIDFAAGPGQGFGTLNFADVVGGNFDADLVDGAVVLIGDVRSVVDQFRIPLSEGLCPGVYYHANVVNQILRDTKLADWPTGRFAAPLVVFALTTLAGWYFWHLPEWWALGRGWLIMGAYFAVGGGAFLSAWWRACLAAFEAGIVLPAAAPLAGVGAVAVSALVWQLVVSIISARRLGERSRRIESLFGRAVSPQVLQVIQASPASIARTEVRDITVLFCDIRGFTAATAEISPEEVAAMLNEYFESIPSAVFEQDGFVDKFVGDELMAVFNVPLPQVDHVMRAARAARSIKRRLAELNVKREARGQQPLDCGIGLHCGAAAVGHIGTAQRANYTVVGNTVNLAARIEEFTTGGEILMSETLRDRLDHTVGVRQWGAVKPRGSPETLRLFELELE